MHRLLPILLAIAVLLCGLHVGESDAPHDVAQHGKSVADAPDDADGHRPDQLAETGHHHCPVAPDPAHSALPCIDAPRPMLVAAAVHPLTSLPQAPPAEPPSA